MADRSATAIGLVLALTLSGLFCGACQTEYDPPSLVNKLRIIAARADPPFVSVATSPTLQLKVIGHDEAAPLCHAWAMCVFALPQGGNYRCVDPRLQVPLGTAATAKVGFADLLTVFQNLNDVLADPDVDLGNFNPGEGDKGCPEPPQLASVQILFKAAEASLYGGTCPTDATAMLEAVCTDRSRCLAGYKQLTLAMRLEMQDCKPALVPAPDKEHNNPELTGLMLEDVPWPASVTPVVRPFVPTEGIVDLDSASLDFEDGQHQIKLEPTWTPESAEVVGQSPDPTKGDDKESLLFSWFSDSGDYKKQRSFDEIPDNHFRPPGAGSKGDKEVRIWVVVRDGRGGSDWLERRLLVRKDGQTKINAICHADHTLPGCQ